MKTITKDILKVAKIASDPTREILSGVYIDNDKMVATDGVKLLEINRENGFDVDDFPVCEAGQSDKVIRDIKEPILIPAKDLLKKQKFYNNKSISILNTANLQDEGGNKISLTITDLEVIKKNIYRKIEGKYPDCQRVMPDQEAKEKIKIDPKLLREILDQFDDPVYIELYGADKPVVIKGTKNDSHIKGLVMSMN